MKIIKIGRSSNNDIVVNDEKVSRMHCQIMDDGSGSYLLIDSNSENGTYVNGVLRRGEVRIHPSDIIRVGNTTLPWPTFFPPPITPPIFTQELKSGGFGITAFVCGILGVFFVAIPFGVIGWNRNRNNRGLAIAGFVLGCVWAFFWFVFWLLMTTAFFWYLPHSF